MAALNYKRALLLACVVIIFLIVLRNNNSQSREPIGPINRNSPPAIGTYDDVRRVLDWNEPQRPTETTRTSVATGGPKKIGILQGGKKQRPKAQQPQIPIEDLKIQPLRKQLSYLFPYDVESKFPAYIWQTWKSSPSEGTFPEDFRPMEASWTVLHPTFIHEVITDAVAGNLVRHLYASVPEIYQAYMALPKPVLKADFFRYLILLARGGIYSDIDTTALKSAVEWVPEDVPRSSYGMVIGIEADPDRPDWQEWYSRRIQFCQWTIQSKPGHPILVDIVASIVEETMARKQAGTLNMKGTKDIIEFTGPAIWTDAIFHYFNNPEFFDMSNSKGNITNSDFTGIEAAKKVGDVIVLPITSFSPGVGQMGAKDENDPMAFVKHIFEGTWKPERERHIGGNDPKGDWNDESYKH